MRGPAEIAGLNRTMKARFLLPLLEMGIVEECRGEKLYGPASLANRQTSEYSNNRQITFHHGRWAGSTSFIRAGGFMSANVLETKMLSQEERLEGMLLRRIGNRVRDLRVIFLADGLILQGAQQPITPSNSPSTPPWSWRTCPSSRMKSKCCDPAMESKKEKVEVPCLYFFLFPFTLTAQPARIV